MPETVFKLFPALKNAEGECSMLLYPNLEQGEQIGRRWVKEKTVPNHLINKKADRKLDHVADIYCTIINDRLTGRKSNLLNKKLFFEGFHYINHLDLSYVYENRLWAFSYNLNCKTAIEVPEDYKSKPCRFIVKNKGKMSIDDAAWHDNGSQCSQQEIKHYLEMLNNRLIIDRIVSLDMTNVEVIYDPLSLNWKINCRTLIGSATWVLIPPVMSLITPTLQESAKMLEFLDLVADAVINKK